MKKAAVVVMVLTVVALFGCTAEEPKKPAAQETPAVPKAAEQRPAEIPFAAVRESSGGVTFRRGVAVNPAPGGTLLKDGDHIVTAKDGYATVEFRNGTILRLSPNSFIKLNDVVLAGRKTLDVGLVMGKLWVKVTMLAGQRFEVTAPTAVAGVRGTQFHAAAAADGSMRVGVEEGVVEVRAKGAKTGLRMNEETTVDAGKSDVGAGVLKLQDWDQWLVAKRADVAKDPVKVAALYATMVGAAGDEAAGLMKKAETVYTEMEKSRAVDRNAKKAEFSDVMDDVRVARDLAEIQMELLLKIMSDLSADPAVPKATKDAFEAEMKKAKAREGMQPGLEKRLRDLDLKAGSSFAAAEQAFAAAPAPAKTVEQPRPKTPRPGAPETAKAAPEPAHVEGLSQVAASAGEAIREMGGAGADGKKVAALAETKPAEGGAEAAPSKAEGFDAFQRRFRECEKKLESIAVSGEMYDNKTRAAMVRTEAKKISGLLPGLRAVAADFDGRSKAAKDASEGRELVGQAQKAHLLVNEIEAKVLWCESQAKHYEATTAE